MMGTNLLARTAGPALEALERLERNLALVIRGKPEAIRRVLAAVLCRGHLLIEDVPGVGKTTLAQALARSLDLKFQRIQFTSDTLPSDIVGVSVWVEERAEFEFRPGPIFANVVLADEINRAAPRTQSALLEATNERAVTIDGRRHQLPDPFLVIATQNPTESVGTYPLPESQLDRFLFRLKIGYPDAAAERELLRGEGGEEALGTLGPVLSGAEVLELQRALELVRVDEKILDYVLALARATRTDAAFRLGASPRALRGLVRAARAEAMISGRPFVTPDDVKSVAVPALAHRILLPGARGDGEREAAAIRRVLDELPVPR
jgi:MoxR-like ATPase